jgi:hypothetical protein
VFQIKLSTPFTPLALHFFQVLLTSKMIGKHLIAVALQAADLAKGPHLQLPHLPSVLLPPTMVPKHNLTGALHIADLAEI